MRAAPERRTVLRAYLFRFERGASPVLAQTADDALAFTARSALVGYVRRTEGLALCGRGAACPG